MANTQSAKKEMRKTVKRTAVNLVKKNTYKQLRKETLAALKEGKKEEAKALALQTAKALDKAAKTNSIHDRKADRLKSRLMKKVNAA